MMNGVGSAISLVLKICIESVSFYSCEDNFSVLRVSFSTIGNLIVSVMRVSFSLVAKT